MTDRKKYKEHFNNSKRFFQQEIWDIDLSQFGKYRSKLIRYVKVILLTVQNFNKINLGWHSVALSFFTTMAFVPFLAVVFAISNRIGIGVHLQELIYQRFGHTDIIDQVLISADNIIQTSRQGIYGIVSFLVFVWLVIWLMMCIEKCFNQIWKVSKNRILWKRLLYYLATLVLSPFIITIFLSLSLTITDVVNALGYSLPLIGSMSNFMIWLIFFFFIFIGLTVIYILVPNANVKPGPALGAAFIAALSFTVVQYLYLETQLFVSRMNAIYGVFAAIPLFMVWLNISWFITLVGSEISYVLQTVDDYELKQ